MKMRMMEEENDRDSDDDDSDDRASHAYDITHMALYTLYMQKNFFCRSPMIPIISSFIIHHSSSYE